MNQNPPIITPLPLNIQLRCRRQELSLMQADVAEALHVTPECISMWEAGRRRMELSKIPRIAVVLRIDARQLCAKALAEYHPLFYNSLFGDCVIAQTNIQQAPA
jgi:DNA-binding XRE family transcriptional regulator